MSEIHTLAIKADRHPLDHEPPDVEFSVRCPGVSDACRMWVECDIPHCAYESGHDAGELIHGKRHQYIASTWSVPTDSCYLIIADEMPDAADYLAAKQHLEPGEYQVRHEFDEGVLAEFRLAKVDA